MQYILYLHVALHNVGHAPATKVIILAEPFFLKSRAEFLTKELKDAQRMACKRPPYLDEADQGSTIFPDEVLEQEQEIFFQDWPSEDNRVYPYFVGCIIYALPDGTEHKTSFA